MKINITQWNKIMPFHCLSDSKWSCFSLKHLQTVQLALVLSLHSGLFGEISSTNSKIIS